MKGKSLGLDGTVRIWKSRLSREGRRRKKYVPVAMWRNCRRKKKRGAAYSRRNSRVGDVVDRTDTKRTSIAVRLFHPRGVRTLAKSGIARKSRGVRRMSESKSNRSSSELSEIGVTGDGITVVAG